MKKILAIILCLCMLLCAACTAGGQPKEKTLRVVATIFPVYDWLYRIIGTREDVEVTLLLDSGVDLHSYQPTAEDIVRITQCDLFVFVGGESDEWVERVLAGANKPRASANLLEMLGDDAKEEEALEGMQEAEHDHGDEDDEHEEHEYDEHIWLSLKNAVRLCRSLSEILSEIDAAHAQEYETRATAYSTQLEELEGRYAAAVAEAKTKTLLFADRFPFRYLAEDYDLTCYAAFSGCSAESEASFETIAFLAAKVDEQHLSYILTVESGNGSVARTVRDSTQEKNQEILVMDSLQSVNAKQVREGVTYLSVMESNLAVLIKALG